MVEQTPSLKFVSDSPDVIDLLAGLSPEQSTALRSHRPDVVAHAQSSYDAIFPNTQTPDSVPGFGIEWRLFSAAKVSELEGHLAARDHYTGRLTALNPQLAAALKAPATLPAPLPSVVAHVELLTHHPGDSRAEDLTALENAGLAAPEIVMLSQVVSFVSFQLRLAHGLNILKETL